MFVSSKCLMESTLKFRPIKLIQDHPRSKRTYLEVCMLWTHKLVENRSENLCLIL